MSLHLVSSLKPGSFFRSTFTPRVGRFVAKTSTWGPKRQCRSAVPRVEAKSKAEEVFQNVIDKGSGVVNTIADFVPESVPRPTAKILTVVIGLALTWWLIQKVISTVVFFGVLGIAGFLFFQSQGKKDASSSFPDDDVNDPMATAKNIMDKYK